jgi:hypothetical protein
VFSTFVLTLGFLMVVACFLQLSPCNFLFSYKLSSTFIPNICRCEVCCIVCCFGMHIINFLSVGNTWVAKVDDESG